MVPGIIPSQLGVVSIKSDLYLNQLFFWFSGTLVDSCPCARHSGTLLYVVLRSQLLPPWTAKFLRHWSRASQSVEPSMGQYQWVLLRHTSSVGVAPGLKQPELVYLPGCVDLLIRNMAQL